MPNVNDITTTAVSRWLYTNGLGPDEGVDLLDDIIRDITGHRSTPTARTLTTRRLNAIYHEATGLFIMGTRNDNRGRVPA